MTAFTSEENKKGFSLRFTACSREPGTWREEVYAAARDIASSAKKHIWVCSSGGIDSEVACRAFFDQGLNFSVLTLEHSAGTNCYDIDFATKWCRERAIKQDLVRIDMQAFLASGMDAYGEKYPAIHPFRYIQIKLLELVEERGGYAVICGDDHLYRARVSDKALTSDDIYLPFSNGHLLPIQWCADNQTMHEPYFHFRTPEMCLAYLRSPLNAFAVGNPDAVFRHPSNTHILKKLVYHGAWPDLPTRLSGDGFEEIRPLFREAQARLRREHGDVYREHDLPVREFERQLTGNTD